MKRTKSEKWVLENIKRALKVITTCDYIDGHLVVKTPDGTFVEVEVDELTKYTKGH